MISYALSRLQRPRGEHGQITAMIVIFMLCLLLAVVAVTDLSAAYLRRQAAFSLADAASLAATRAAAVGSIYSHPHARYVPIDQRAAGAAVRRYLHSVGAYADYPGLRAHVRVLGPRVRVVLTMPYRLPVPVPGVQRSTTIHAFAAAELPIYQ